MDGTTTESPTPEGAPDAPTTTSDSPTGEPGAGAHEVSDTPGPSNPAPDISEEAPVTEAEVTDHIDDFSMHVPEELPPVIESVIEEKADAPAALAGSPSPVRAQVDEQMQQHVNDLRESATLLRDGIKRGFTNHPTTAWQRVLDAVERSLAHAEAWVKKEVSSL